MKFPRGEMHGGGPPCLFAIDDPGAWLEGRASRINRLRREAEDRVFYLAHDEERIDPRCAAEGCPRGAMPQGTLTAPQAAAEYSALDEIHLAKRIESDVAHEPGVAVTAGLEAAVHP
jgi:hypothetical protein